MFEVFCKYQVCLKGEFRGEEKEDFGNESQPQMNKFEHRSVSVA